MVRGLFLYENDTVKLYEIKRFAEQNYVPNSFVDAIRRNLTEHRFCRVH